MNKWERRDRKLYQKNRQQISRGKVHLGTNKFHIYAKFRYPELKSVPQNITITDIDKHRDYHQLFSLKTPAEILHYLNDYFWGNLFEIHIEGEDE